MAGSDSNNQGPGRTARVLLHSALFLAFSALSATLRVWPNWANADKSESTLEILREREAAVGDQLEVVRAMNERLRDWKQDGRRVFLEEELPQYPALVKQAVRDGGATLVTVEVTRRATSRWRPLRVPSTALMHDEESGEEIQPRAVHVVLRGRFEAVYRSVATLSQQQQLFVPDRWDIGEAGAPGELRADIWATVFVVQGAADAMKPTAPAPSGSPKIGPPNTRQDVAARQEASL